jgi:serine O-acetyltransferase
MVAAPPPDPAGSRPRREHIVTDEERGRRLRALAREMADSYRDLGGLNRLGSESLPSSEVISQLLEELLALVFPGYHGAPVPPGADLELQLGGRLDNVERLLADVLADILRFCHRKGSRCEDLWAPELGGLVDPAGPGPAEDRYALAARRLTLEYLAGLPTVRRLADQDVRAAFEGDPAATSWEEIILCYPGVYAVTVHRLAHPLHGLGVPLLPRMMSEWAHRQTGIDIHPGAGIGASFFIDHGTGVVIGETTHIGERVKLYQGVTLGALSFPRNPDGTLVKGGQRHPTIGDDVTIYAGATILGGETEIGNGAVIGGGTWITSSVAAGARVVK